MWVFQIFMKSGHLQARLNQQILILVKCVVIVMNCNTEIHDEMVTMEHIDCPFCDEQLQEPLTTCLPCCEKQNIFDNEGTNVCQSCGTVNSYGITSEYIDFHENKHRFVQKSVYQRKYHLENKLRDICSKYNLQISVHDLAKIHQVFIEIDKILPQLNGDRKRMISINFILKQLFKILGIPHENILVTKSKKTMEIYKQNWLKIMLLIGDKKNIIKR